MESDESKPQELRLKPLIEVCLEDELYNQLIHALADLSRKGMEDQLNVVFRVISSGLCSDEQIQAMSRLLFSGAAQRLAEMIDEERGRRVHAEIKEMTQ